MDRRATFALVTDTGSASGSLPAAGPVAAPSHALDPRGLVASARRGDAGAFDSLYREFAPLVHGVLIAGLRADEVDDAVQEVFLSAWRSLASLREDEHVGAWLATIARNRAHRQRAQRGERMAIDEAAHPEDQRARPDASAESAEVLDVLRGLPEAYRETLALRLVEGLNGPEIAAITGLTHGSVRVNLTRGMKLLRDALSERGWP